MRLMGSQPTAMEIACFLRHKPRPLAGRLREENAQLKRVIEGWNLKLITESYFKKLLTRSAPATHPNLTFPGLKSP